MKIDIYHLYRHFDYANMVAPIMIDVLRSWAQSAGWEARTFVCREKDVRISSDADVVAFSVYTQTAPAAYRLAGRLRGAGKIVILGGPHFRGDKPGEGLEHCDVLAGSICKEQWIKLLERIQEGAIRPSTGAGALYLEDAEQRFRYPEDLFQTSRELSWRQIPSVPTSLGCPYDCSFCNPYMRGKYSLRDIGAICADLARLPRWKPVFIADASFGLNKQYTTSLMRAVAPLNMNLLIESTFTRLQDIQLLDALAEGGVKWISVGIESFNESLNKHGRGPLMENIDRLLDNVHDRGMLIECNFICGLDSDGPETFDQIHEFYHRTEVDLIGIDILTPYPNTRLFRDLQEADRIIDTDWEHYDYRHVVYRPKRMSEEHLINSFVELYKSLYSPGMVLKKVKDAYRLGGVSIQTAGMAFFNLWFMLDALRKERAFNRTGKHVIQSRLPAEPME